MSAGRPVGEPDNVTREWWDATRERKLMVQRCAECGHAQLYPRSLCTSCHRASLELAQASGRGVIYSHTTVHRAPHPAFSPPYIVALIRLEEGPVVMANVDGEVGCDQPVRLVWEDLEDGRMLPQFTTTFADNGA